MGLRTKLGGKPDWEQGDEYPNCPDCKEEMVFIAQIDSIEHESEYNPLSKSALGHQDYMFCDVGMIYVFYCFGCNEAKAVTQFY
ncbi:MAG: YwqG family protein [Planctomycetota bacterium]|nr:YwqG family protein [Planctomycetota bacterium]